MNEPEKMAPNTESVYWAMLMELDYNCKDNDVGLKETIRAAYRQWNATHADKKPLKPRFDEVSHQAKDLVFNYRLGTHKSLNG